jgi:tetratricopeptide (TPR) repeat protein
VNLWFFLKGLTGKFSGEEESSTCNHDAGSFDNAHQSSGGLRRAQQLNDQGLVQLEQEQFNAAAASFASAIEERYDFSDAHHNLGRVHLAQGRSEDAADCFYLATHFAPGAAASHLDLGIALAALGKADEATTALHRALELDPALPDAHRCLARLLKSSGELEEAVAHYRRLVELSPASADAHCDLGYALFRLERFDEAEASFVAALRIKNDFSEAYHNYGLLLLHRGEPDRALAYFETALTLRPSVPETVSCIGHALRYLGRYDEALTRYDEALAIRPDFGDAVLNRCHTYLVLGDFERGWREFDRRFVATDTRRRNFAFPVWSGEDLAGKVILVWGEQGVGDQIQFASLLPDMVERAGRCIYECAGKLVPLLARSFPGALIVARADPPHPATQGEVDYQIAVGSAARWLRPTLESFPRRAGYLVADEARVGYWRERLEGLGAGLKVGFCWRSNNLKGERALSCTRLEQWGELFGVPGVQWVCLQYDECEEELEAARSRFGVALQRFGEVDYFDDLDEVAALMKALDLVISAPTTVSVQAAALGVEVWQMHYGVYWQSHGTAGNPWFPTLVPYKRRWDQDWSEILAQLADQLRQRTRR